MHTSLVLFAAVAAVVSGHGFLQDPPARNCMWRFGFKTPKNYDDDGLYCGGFSAFNERNHGACGVCGDAAHMSNQPHADGGRFAKGIIVREYNQGSIIDVKVRLTTSHYGYFQFRIGDFSNTKTTGDRTGHLVGHLMELADGSGNKFMVRRQRSQEFYTIRLRLPQGLTCERCVMQWWYKGGNSWGCDGSGCGMGRGKQEHFVNCADVKIKA